MLTRPALSAAVSRLWLPRASLASCVRGVMMRDTRGVPLAPEQRFNHYPASPLCAISWWLHGSGELLPLGAPASLDTPRTPMPARIVFSGPHTRPSVSWNVGEAHGMMLVLMPDAVHRLLGLDMAQWVNRHVPVQDVLPAPWLQMCEAVAWQPDDEARVALMQDFLDPLWQDVRSHRSMQAHRYHDWAVSLAMRAATSGPGRSLRQVERRIKQWAGQPLRELRGMGRAERAFFETLATADAGHPPNWADVADATGYADQSHLCRETRRVTGFAPNELYRRIAEDEGFWSYRIWQ